MKSDWQTKKLSEICKIGAGNSAPQKKEFFIDGKYPFFRTSDVGKIHIGNISESVDFLNEKGIKGLKLFNKGTILLPKSGASTFLNHRVILEIDGYVSSHLATIITDEKILNNSFLFYFLQEVKTQDLIQDHKYPSLNLPVIGEIKIAFPPLSEQQRIVKILDEAFEKIDKVKENIEKNLQNSKNIFDVFSQKIFSFNKETATKLNDVCEISSKLIDPKKDQYQKMFHVGGANIESKSGSLINLQTAEQEKLISGKFLFDSSMILYSKIRPYLVKIARPDFTGLCSADIYPLTPIKNKIDKNYLFYLLMSSTFTQYAISGSSRAGMPKVNRNHLFNFNLYLPSLIEQKEIVKNLDKLSEETKRLESIYRQKLADLEELKKSILNKAFSGEL